MSREMSQEEVKRLLELLDEAIRRSGRSRREIERTLGLGQGYLGSLFSGRIALKVWHVFVLGRELGLEPLTLFYDAAPPKDPASLLERLEAGYRRAGSPPIPPAPPSMSREEIEELIKKTLREELARLVTLAGGEPAAG